jgi:hypothetical protein
MQYLSKVGDHYKVHDSKSDAIQYEIQNAGFTNWIGDTRQPLKPWNIMQKIKFALMLIGAITLPISGVLFMLYLSNH